MAITNPLNSEAGLVPAPTDPREIAAAVRSRKIMWRAFPYLWWRYGERGRRFGDSDSAYILTLLKYGEATIDRQVDWMAGMLASRGMPTWVLELQLRALVQILRRSFQGTDRFDLLLRAADRLRELRRSRFTDEDVAALSARFAERAGFPDRRWAKGTGALLLCAVADELNGRGLAVESVESWLTDGGIFPGAWIEAVKSTIASARQIAASRA